MKKKGIINRDLLTSIAEMGHKDFIVLADAGFPIPKTVKRIDLAITKGYPKFIKILKAILGELVIEKVILAEEIKKYSPELNKEIMEILPEVEVEYIFHNDFKLKTRESRAVIRSGEITPYANIILVSGVDF